jgi:hypothetical protein
VSWEATKFARRFCHGFTPSENNVLERVCSRLRPLLVDPR